MIAVLAEPVFIMQRNDQLGQFIIRDSAAIFQESDACYSDVDGAISSTDKTVGIMEQNRLKLRAPTRKAAC